MTFRLKILKEAKEQILTLKSKPYLEKRLKAVNNALKKLQENPRHPGLNIHPIENLWGPNREKVWEAYAENDTPGAYRIFFYYGPERQMISILSIIAHPD